MHRSILQLALPGMVSSVLQTFYQLVDAFWIGKIGSAALAAIGGLSFVLWAVFSLTALSSGGSTTLVAQNIGAGRLHQARFSAGQGMIVNTLSAFVLGLLVFIFQQDFYRVMGFEPLVSRYAVSYMNIVLVGLPFAFAFVGLEAIFRGLGDTTRPMIIMALALALNAILDPLLILGWLGFPALGIKGAALATILAQTVAVALALFFLKKKNFLPTLFLKEKIKWSKTIIKRLLSIGSPLALGGFSFSLIYVFLTNIIAHFGTAAIAAIGVCHRIEGIAWFACVGYSAAAAAMVGQFIGAAQLKQAKRAAWWVNGYGVVTLFFAALLFYFYPSHLLSLFSSDTEVIRIGTEYLKTIAVFEIFLALEVIMEGVFSGMGYTVPVMLISIPLTALRIPIAWYLALKLHMGAQGIWWAIAGTTFLKGALITLLFASGFWQKKLIRINTGKPIVKKFRWKT